MNRVLTVDEMVEIRDECRDFNRLLDKLAAETREPAQRIRKAVGTLTTTDPVSYCWSPTLQKVAAIGLDELPVNEQAYCKSALDSVAQLEPVNPDYLYIKVAYSPVLRRAGEYLNFFPRALTSGPDISGPTASMLTTGLVGAGLGYGAGWLGEKLMPKRWEKGKLRKTLATVGGVLGAAPGAVWGANNLANKRKFNDNSMMAGIHPALRKDMLEVRALDERYVGEVEKYANFWASQEEELLKQAYGSGGYSPDYDLGIDVNSLGQTLWEIGAPGELTRTTMGTLHAAQQMPGGKAPGHVTPPQLGQLAMNMGGGYLTGAIAGTVLGKLTGLPEKDQGVLKRTGAYLGVVKTIVPALFGY